jgi:lysophospholipase L1-like esterase
MRPFRYAIIAALFVLSTGIRAYAQAADASQHPFESEIRAFEKWDRQNSAPKEAVLFVGSSSIVRWTTAVSFPNLTVVNRGFGGSKIADVNYYADRIVMKYSPEVVVFYAGDNDIDAGRMPAQVLRDYQTFVDKVAAARPDTQILFISIKPSLARWNQWPAMQQANDLVRAYSATRKNLHYLDVSPPMLGGDGRPRPELFVSDGLHMTPAGYAIWTELVGRALEPMLKQARR